MRGATNSDDDFGAFKRASEPKSIEPKIVEGSTLRAVDVPQTGRTELTHFLDGIQKTWRRAYFGMSPIVFAYTSAALLARVEGTILPPEPECFDGGLDALVPDDPELVSRLSQLPGLDAVHPVMPKTVGSEIAFVDQASLQIQKLREEREVRLASDFSSGWLMIDGGIGKCLGRNPSLTTVLGVVKTHAQQYFATPEQIECILNLRACQRTTAFIRPEDPNQGHEVYSFYLKLRESADQGPTFGIVRVELPPRQESLDRIDEIAGWLLAERAPSSLPDPRYDRMLYPIRLVEKHLRTRQPSDAAILRMLG